MAMRYCGVALLLLALFALPREAAALAPEEVLVVANRNARESVDLAAYYMKRRGIPAENLLKIWVTDAEKCSRGDYDQQIAGPVRKYLAGENGARIRAAVLLYGVPLRVEPPGLTFEDHLTLGRLEGERQELKRGPAPDEEEKRKVEKRLQAISAEIDAVRKVDQEASVDSELALVRVPEHELRGGLANPLFVGYRAKGGIKKEDVVPVCRLDGPSPAVVRRLVDDSIATEREGLHGNAYLDARWKDPGNSKDLSGYALYDKSLHEAGPVLKERGLNVVLEETEALFPSGARLPAALYCGWYRLGSYVDAFAWQKGAVGYHIASTECSTLRWKDSTVWCKRMLEEGVAATLGPVGEPYVQAFPPPHIFFRLLTDGRLTLLEAYALSLPHLSWKMVLVGDPLYRPFRPRADRPTD